MTESISRLIEQIAELPEAWHGEGSVSPRVLHAIASHADRNSPLFRPEAVTYIEGPTQKTLPRHTFANEVQIALIDGPHGYPFPDLEYTAERNAARLIGSAPRRGCSDRGHS
jgi:hypothetical protein